MKIWVEYVFQIVGETFILANRLSNHPKILNGSGILNAQTLNNIDHVKTLCLNKIDHVKTLCRKSRSQWFLKNDSDKKKPVLLTTVRDWNGINLFNPPPRYTDVDNHTQNNLDKYSF